jgi:cobyrinic acid a,c-diamide synthase
MTEKNLFPRIMIAGTASGTGKTTVTMGIMAALKKRNIKISGFKCGPDYIDPMFHTKIIGTHSRNLDLFLLDEPTVKSLFCKNARGSDLSVLEGVMGYYDGLSVSAFTASSYHLACCTQTPVVLVVNVDGMSRSVAAMIQGYRTYQSDSGIQGVILNHCSEKQYQSLKPVLEQEQGISVVGYLPKMRDCALESRHLGLVTADEVEDFKQKLSRLVQVMEQTVDFDQLIKLAESAPPLEVPELVTEKITQLKPKIAVAMDRAFCFYYQDNLDLLVDLGAELVLFSPLSDEAVPNGCSALYLGGGYPELYTRELSENKTMLQSVKNAVACGMPTIAECGGFMYLQNTVEDRVGTAFPMVGALPGESYKTQQLNRFGYLNLTANSDNLLCRQGEKITAHEFHFWDSTDCGAAFTAEKPVTGTRWPCIFAGESLFAGYPHIHFYSNKKFAVHFVRAAEKFERKYSDDDDHSGN